jgi:hypothetical protein
VARSFKTYPVWGYSDKFSKQKYHRRFRKGERMRVRHLMFHDLEAYFTFHYREVSDVWDFASDGGMVVDVHSEWMRK